MGRRRKKGGKKFKKKKTDFSLLKDKPASHDQAYKKSRTAQSQLKIESISEQKPKRKSSQLVVQKKHGRHTLVELLMGEL